jgi:hypothetical protein
MWRRNLRCVEEEPTHFNVSKVTLAGSGYLENFDEKLHCYYNALVPVVKVEAKVASEVSFIRRESKCRFQLICGLKMMAVQT